MNEYLEKNKVINLLEHNDKVIHYVQGTANRIVDRTVQALCQVIIEAPAADVQPVKHGYWSECYTDSYHYSGICSVCGGGAIRKVKGKPLKYCPNCGARMDGETNG